MKDLAAIKALWPGPFERSPPLRLHVLEMEFTQLFNVVQLTNALAPLLTILASGIALISGLRDVMNFGHGALYMPGACSDGCHGSESRAPAT